MRAKSDRLHDLTDGAGLDELAGLDRRAVLHPLAVHDRIDALRLGLDPTHLGQLLERRDARLVDHVVLAVLHHAHAERRALVGNGRAQDQLHRLVLEDLGLAAGDLDLRKRLDERSGEVRLLGVHRDEFAAAADHGLDLTVDVAVVDADDAELDLRRRLPRERRAKAGCRQVPQSRPPSRRCRERTHADPRAIASCRRSREWKCVWLVNQSTSLPRPSERPGLVGVTANIGPLPRPRCLRGSRFNTSYEGTRTARRVSRESTWLGSRRAPTAGTRGASSARRGQRRDGTAAAPDTLLRASSCLRCLRVEPVVFVASRR